LKKKAIERDGESKNEKKENGKYEMKLTEIEETDMQRLIRRAVQTDFLLM
jgi:hypothetical protein